MNLFSKVLVSSLFTVGWAQAAKDPIDVKAELDFTSNYVFRGRTQTDENVAIQGGFNVSHASGLYANLWGSNVDFGETTTPTDDQAHVEIDYSLGYTQNLPSGTRYGTGVTYYTYPGAGSDLNYDFYELTLALGYKQKDTLFGFSYAFSPEFSGDAGKTHYFRLDFGYTVPRGLGFNAHVGHQTFSAEKVASSDYTDYGISLAYPIKNYFDISVGYTDTDLDNIDGTDGQTSFTISKHF